MDSEEEELDIATCTRGQYFGELALVTNKPRAASAYAVDSVKCLGTTTDFKQLCKIKYKSNLYFQIYLLILSNHFTLICIVEGLPGKGVLN